MQNIGRHVALVLGLVGMGGLAASVSILVAEGCSSTNSGAQNSPVPKNDAGAAQGNDAQTEAEKDAQQVAQEDAGANAASNVNISLLVAQATAQYCTTYAACCATVDAGSFDTAECTKARMSNYGGFALLAGHTPALRVPLPGTDGGTMNNPNVRYDQTAAASCLARAQSYTCDISADDYQKLRDVCFGAYIGLVREGGGCTDSIECAAGRCVGGTCGVLAAIGAACVSSEDCAYRGTSVPSAYCTSVDGVASGVCAERKALGAACGDVFDYESECTSGVCDDVSLTCASTFTQFRYCGIYRRNP